MDVLFLSLLGLFRCPPFAIKICIFNSVRSMQLCFNTCPSLCLYLHVHRKFMPSLKLHSIFSLILTMSLETGQLFSKCDPPKPTNKYCHLNRPALPTPFTLLFKSCHNFLLQYTINNLALVTKSPIGILSILGKSWSFTETWSGKPVTN